MTDTELAQLQDLFDAIEDAYTAEQLWADHDPDLPIAPPPPPLAVLQDLHDRAHHLQQSIRQQHRTEELNALLHTLEVRR